MAKRIWKKVKHAFRYIPKCAPVGGSALSITLECGHVVRRKGSYKVPGRCLCLQCEHEAEVEEKNRAQWDEWYA